MNVRCKFWLEEKGMVFGEGLFTLLQAVDRHGSLNQAARELAMAYRQAWGRIKRAEQAWGYRLLETQVGGEAGGGARLTWRARELVDRYRHFRKLAERAVEEAYQEVFRC